MRLDDSADIAQIAHAVRNSLTLPVTRLVRFVLRSFGMGQSAGLEAFPIHDWELREGKEQLLPWKLFQCSHCKYFIVSHDKKWLSTAPGRTNRCGLPELAYWKVGDVQGTVIKLDFQTKTFDLVDTDGEMHTFSFGSGGGA